MKTDTQTIKLLDIDELSNGFPAITAAFGETLAEAGALCLESQGHTQGQRITINGDYSNEYLLHWQDVTDQIRRTYNDEEVATEYGAVGIAILLTNKETGLSPIKRSKKGTGFDYWIGKETDIPLQERARLEISGIRCGNDSAINTRVQIKKKQTDKSDRTSLPALISDSESKKIRMKK
ncbi:hypothetical protein MCHI_000980 [Candidatus Magnetoovum chiemensis]|nr:hypothetical protein MCHI_000980 [Candidatus Magnetoovum chiemensis]